MNKLKEKIRNEIIHWNNSFPLDYYWRKKYNIPFGSAQHRSATFLDMARDYEEERMMRELTEKSDEPELVPTPKLSQKEIDSDFENFSFSDITN